VNVEQTRTTLKIRAPARLRPSLSASKAQTVPVAVAAKPLTIGGWVGRIDECLCGEKASKGEKKATLGALLKVKQRSDLSVTTASTLAFLAGAEGCMDLVIFLFSAECSLRRPLSSPEAKELLWQVCEGALSHNYVSVYDSSLEINAAGFRRDSRHAFFLATLAHKFPVDHARMLAFSLQVPDQLEQVGDILHLAEDLPESRKLEVIAKIPAALEELGECWHSLDTVWTDCHGVVQYDSDYILLLESVCRDLQQFRGDTHLCPLFDIFGPAGRVNKD